jgi:hypothetical protein
VKSHAAQLVAVMCMHGTVSDCLLGGPDVTNVTERGPSRETSATSGLRSNVIVHRVGCAGPRSQRHERGDGKQRGDSGGLCQCPGGQPGEPLGYLVVMGDSASERSVPIFDQLFVGRECAGISELRRLVLDDPEISRTHLEIRLDAASDQAFVIDTSSNGTLLNGARLERAVTLPIRPGDEIRIGEVALTFRSQRFTTATGIAPRRTRIRIGQAAMVMVVGDIVNYSTISQVTDFSSVASWQPRSAYFSPGRRSQRA